MGAGWVNSFSAGRNRDADMVWFLVIATITNLPGRSAVSRCYRSPARSLGHCRCDNPVRPGPLVGGSLWQRQRDVDDFRIRDAVVIGLFQVLAIIPRHVTLWHYDHRRIATWT